MALKHYHDTSLRGAEWLLQQQNDDGSFIRPDLQADVYYKAAYALGITGHPVEANRLLDWIKQHRLREAGEIIHFDNHQATYKNSWICQGAHRLGRFDISCPVMQHILRCQAPCGGFFQLASGNDQILLTCSPWAGLAALYMGHREAADRTVVFLVSCLEQQPDHNRFYCWASPEGRLVTEANPISGQAPYLDMTQTRQPYYIFGLPFLFLIRHHLATGSKESFEAARRYFELQLRCAEDAFSYLTSGKSAVAAAIYYTLTRDERALDAACQQADYLAQMQQPDGMWTVPWDDNWINRLDATAEFTVFMSEIPATLNSP